MAFFYIALIIGAGVAVIYLWLVIAEFRRVRREFTAGGTGAALAAVRDEDRPEVYERQGRNFSWMAGGGVVISTSLLALASVTASAWYVLPFLAIGSAIAVILAFLVDRREAATAGGTP
jgi:hypothetical protein